MTTNPFNKLDESFQDLFMDTIGISCNRPNGKIERTSVNSCVFPIEEVEPFSHADEDTDIKRMTILIMKKDWTFNEPMKIGDDIILDNNTKLKVSSVDVEHSWFKIIARSI